MCLHLRKIRQPEWVHHNRRFRETWPATREDRTGKAKASTEGNTPGLSDEGKKIPSPDDTMRVFFPPWGCFPAFFVPG